MRIIGIIALLCSTTGWAAEERRHCITIENQGDPRRFLSRDVVTYVLSGTQYRTKPFIVPINGSVVSEFPDPGKTLQACFVGTSSFPRYGEPLFQGIQGTGNPRIRGGRAVWADVITEVFYVYRIEPYEKQSNK